ncbi:RHS repeat-associated core domain-containing protein [Labrys neptuniae]|uniref:RHS repeat-associated core domain-containing protein n=1 Tax=Labrys neptuniae TaxID=376174 RepID=A0ABV3PKY2_9HYPH
MADGGPNPNVCRPGMSAADLRAEADKIAQDAAKAAATIPGRNTTCDHNKNSKGEVCTDSTSKPDFDDTYKRYNELSNKAKAAQKKEYDDRLSWIKNYQQEHPIKYGLWRLATGDDDHDQKYANAGSYDRSLHDFLSGQDRKDFDDLQEAINQNANGGLRALGSGFLQGTGGIVEYDPKDEKEKLNQQAAKEGRPLQYGAGFFLPFIFFRKATKGEPVEATRPPPVRPPPVEPPPVRPPPTESLPVTAGEPVSVTSGEYLETWHDFLIPGAALPLDGSRYMGLKLPMPTRWRNPLGACQISAFDEFFANPRRGELIFYQADGKVVAFDRPFNFLPSINGAYPHLELKAPALGRLCLKDRRIVKHFTQYDDRFYYLEKIEDLNGNALTFTRSEVGALERIESSDGLSLSFENDGEGRRLSITLIGTDGSSLELVRYAYDTRRRMVSADCAFGMSVRYYWSTTRPLLKRWYNLTRRSETVFQYDAEGRVVHTATNGIWNDDRFRYDSQARETTYLPGGEETRAQRFHYDEQQNVTAEIDALGGAVRHRYNQAGMRVSTTDANGHTGNTKYDQYGNVREFTDAEGRSTIYGWGPNGDVDTIVDGAGGVRKFQNDHFGNVVVARDAEMHETRFARDERGRLIRTLLADGSEETRAYDEHGRLVQIRDAKGGLTSFTYDSFGRLIQWVDALGGVTKLAYEAGAGGFATPTRLTRPDGVSVGRQFDAEGSLASVNDGEGRQWHYRFGAFEVLQAITDPKGGELSFGYDSDGHLITVTNAMGRIYSLNRDVAGRVIEEEDFDGRVTRYTRDAGGRVTETIKPDGGRLVYGYDRTNRITHIETFAPKVKREDTNAKTAPLDVTRFWYDGRGLVIKAENGASLVEYERDKNGTITAETVNGRRVAVKLDAMGRRVERELSTPKAADPGKSLVAYSYDPLGLIESLTIDGHAPLSFQHDALGRETRRSSPIGFHLASRHDAVGQLIEQTGGRVPGSSLGMTGFGQAAFREAPASGAGLAIERRYRWDRANAPLAILDGLWGETNYEYDANGQVEATRAGEGTSDELRERFQYDAARNLVGMAAAGAGQLHGFGEMLGKLTAWSNTPGGVVRIARGPRGERLALTHDECGRVIERKVERNGFRPKVWHYGWDQYDRLVKCMTPEGDVWRYGYDAFGRRVWKVRELTQAEARSHASRFSGLIAAGRVTPDYASSLLPLPSERREDLSGRASGDKDRPPIVGVAYGWDGDVIAEEAPLRLDGAIDWHQATRWHYESNSFRPLAKQEALRRTRRSDGTVEETPGRLLNIITDHLGTPREALDECGKIQWAASYTTWGLIRGLKVAASTTANDDYVESFRPGNDAGGIRVIDDVDDTLVFKAVAFDSPQGRFCPIRFQGQWQDAETGLYYNRYRHYDPLAGQFASPDPIKLEGGDRPQGYVERPTTWIDPLGLASTSNARSYPDGSIRTPDGKFASQLGVPAPGTTAAHRFAEFLRTNGVDVVGEELTVKGPLGSRRYDIVTRNPDGTLHGIEVKSGNASRNAYQNFTDMFVNRFGANGTGPIQGMRMTGTTTVYVPSGGF